MKPLEVRPFEWLYRTRPSRHYDAWYDLAEGTALQDALCVVHGSGSGQRFLELIG